MREVIRFIRKGRPVELRDVRPGALLLDYLRDGEGGGGAKDGCGEGGCGACTVVLGRLRNNRLVYEPVNACIQLLATIDGYEVVTVEDLAEDDKLHPVQAALAQQRATQCGFCTPGFVMSMFALYQATERPVTSTQVNDWLAGNLCRCTGYRSIIDAAIAACARSRGDLFRERAGETAVRLAGLVDDEDIFIGDEHRFFAAPASLDSLAELYESYPTATVVAGATDVGPWISKELRDLSRIIHIGRVRGLDAIEDRNGELIIGAAATLAQIEPALRTVDADLGELVRRFGGKQIRSRATLGGNIMTGAPTGDMLPALIALDATLELRRGRKLRSIPVEDFFIDYGKQDRGPGEFLAGVLVPKLTANEIFRCFKVAKRFDQDIAVVLGAFRLTLGDDGRISEARLAYGGMAATPRRATTAEAALEGTLLRDSRAWGKAFAGLRTDFKPADDHRASARYRSELAHALLGKALIEAAGTASSRVRLIGQRKKQADAAY